MGKKMKRRHESGVETTPEIRLGDSEMIVTPKIHQKDKKRKKQKKVETTHEPPLEVESNKNLKKIIDGLSDRLNEMTEIVQKLKKTSELLEKEKETTPEEKVVECLYESEEAFIKHRRTIFVLGFDCSFPRDDIRTTLIKHFSSCGEVSRVAIPFHCETGSPMGFAFINMRKDEEKALTLDGSYLGGLRLEVTMAIKRSEYYGYTNHLGCKRCRAALMKRRMESFYDRPRLRFHSPDIN